MAKRKSKDEVSVVGAGLVVATVEPVPPEVSGGLDRLAADWAPPAPLPPPTVEERLAKLESLLAESDKIIRQQASAIAIGVENAERLRLSRVRVDKLEKEMDEMKKSASEAKKRYESAVKEHFELEADLDSPQARLPFPPEPAAPEPEAAASSPPAPVADDDWRTVGLATLDLPKAVVERLAEANLSTIGALSDYLAPSANGFCKRLNDLPGIGQAKAELIEQALAKFWESIAPEEPCDVNGEILAGLDDAEARQASCVGFEPTVGAEFDDEEDYEDTSLPL